MANAHSSANEAVEKQVVEKHGGPKPIWIPALVVLFVLLAGATYALDMTSHPHIDHAATAEEGSTDH